jgi:hypothetical protein
MASVTVTTSVRDVGSQCIRQADPRGVEVTTWYCFHCYARNSRPTGVCTSCGVSIESPRPLTYDERLIWALDHPVPDTAITAARVLRDRRPPAAAEPLRRAVEHPRDPYLAAAALRALVAIEGVDATGPLLRQLASGGPVLLRRAAQAELEAPDEATSP